MTAEIAVLNTTAVALAADSAASTMPFADKIYSSVDKLFQLADNAPVGIMINGSSEFLGVPWETIIKVYRKERQGQEFPLLNDYKDDFLEFISTHQGMFPCERQTDFTIHLVRSYLNYLRELIEGALDEAISHDGISPEEVPSIVHSAIEEQYELVAARDRLSGFDTDEITTIKQLFGSRIESVKDEVFGNLPLEAQSSRLVICLVVEVLTRNYMYPERTGLIFAGFGEEEYFPRLVPVDVGIMVNGRVRKVEDEEQCVTISPESPAAIMPFAQQEMVRTFLEGIHPDMAEHLATAIAGLFSEFVNRLCHELENRNSGLVQGLNDRLTTEVQSLLDELHSHWEGLNTEHWMPIIDNVAVLPIDELAAMAEALVNLTKFRRRISQDRETVGGPIDVVVISKGDGFVWVKQKHYFERS